MVMFTPWKGWSWSLTPSNSGTSQFEVEIQKLVAEHNAILDVKKREFEVELDEKRKSFEGGLKTRLMEVEKKEGDINRRVEKVAKLEMETHKLAKESIEECDFMRMNLDLKEEELSAWEEELNMREKVVDKVAKQEQALEKKAEKLKEKEKEYEEKVKALKEREKSIKSEEKRLEIQKGEIACEREELLILKAEVEEIKANNEEQLLRINEEINHLKVTEEERSECFRLQSQLKHEIDQYKFQKLLLKVAEDMRLQNETFEREWDELDQKRADVERERKNVIQQKKGISKQQQLEEEKLRNEKQATHDYVKRELETLRLAKESFTAEMELEKASLAEKARSEKNQMLLDFELWRQKLEADIQNQLEQKERDLLERKKLFGEKIESELNTADILGESNAAEAAPGESRDVHETEVPNGNAKVSADVNSESQKSFNRGEAGNAQKRNQIQTSQVTASGHDDANEGWSDSFVSGQRKRRRQKAAKDSGDVHETQVPNGKAKDSADVNSESQEPSNTGGAGNAQKRNRVQTSQMTASGHDAGEGQSDSFVSGQRKRRRHKAATPSVQTTGERRYNLSRPKIEFL